MSDHAHHHHSPPSSKEIRDGHKGAHQRHDVHAPGGSGVVQFPVDPTSDEFSADLAHLQEVRGGLGQRAERLGALLANAQELQHNLTDGHGPISREMSALFKNRANEHAGATWALTQYQNEFNNLLSTLDQTIAAYQAAEQEAVRQLPETEAL